jgi:predicted small secreted protein
MKRALLLTLAAVFVMMATSGCNALRGAGTDISDSGKHIQNIGK